MEFAEKSLKVKIDTSKCETCQSKACADACKKYARGLLVIDENGKASVGNRSEEEVLRLGTECLACEYACKFYGNDAIEIDIPITGLDEYLKKRNLA
jgi:Fe-S-cluster-containing dehydrogenase component